MRTFFLTTVILDSVRKDLICNKKIKQKILKYKRRGRSYARSIFKEYTNFITVYLNK